MIPRRLLVTGGTGFLGSALVRRLVKAGHDVRVLDDNSRGAARRLSDIAAGFEMVEGDVRDGGTVARAARGAEAIIHLAAVNGTEFFYSKPEVVLDVGVRGMLAVLDACRANGIGNLVVASSSEVYQTPPTVPTDESVPLSVPDVLNPRYSYGGAKIISELLAINYGRRDFDRVVVFRPHNVYGPDMGWEHVLPQFALRAHEAVTRTSEDPLPFPIQGDGTHTRAFIHVDDFTDGLMTVIDRGEHLGIYHIGNPEETSVAETARKVVAYFGRTAKLETSREPAGGTPRRCPDIGRLRTLGFTPRIGLDEGLPSLIDWYVANARLNPSASH